MIVFTDKIAMLEASLVAILTWALGEHWFLFVAFLILNFGDYISGVIKARIAQKSNSVTGLNGLLKKMGYWVMIMLAFMMSAVFIEIGEVIGINLGVTSILGYLVLAALIVNECRSIVENLVEAGYNPPAFLTRGLEVASNTLNQVNDEEDEKKKE